MEKLVLIDQNFESGKNKKQKEHSSRVQLYLRSAIHTAKSAGASKGLHSSETCSIANLRLSHKPAIQQFSFRRLPIRMTELWEYIKEKSSVKQSWNKDKEPCQN